MTSTYALPPTLDTISPSPFASVLLSFPFDIYIYIYMYVCMSHFAIIIHYVVKFRENPQACKTIADVNTREEEEEEEEEVIGRSPSTSIQPWMGNSDIYGLPTSCCSCNLHRYLTYTTTTLMNY